MGPKGRMVFWSYVVTVVLAVVLGFVGGRVALVRGRDRVTEPAASRDVTFVLAHLDDQTWTLTNVGDATAAKVTVVPLAEGIDSWPPQPPPGHVSTATSELLPTLGPGARVSLWLSRHDVGQQVLVSWTSEDGFRMGPVTLDVPAP